MKAMILAAGMGTRLLPHTRHTPKPLFTINQRPMLALIMERLERAGCTAIIINTHHLHERIEAFLTQYTLPIPVSVRHEPEILGTGGGIRNTADLWEDAPLLLINADIVSDIDPAEVYRFHLNHNAPVTMVMHDYPAFNTVSVDAEGSVTDFTTDPKADPVSRKLAFTGIHVVDRRILDFLPPDGPAHIIDAYTKMIDAGERIRAMVMKGHYWRDIGTPDSYRAAAIDQMAPIAFKQATGRSLAAPLQIEPLKGDGSDRRWFRLRSGNNTLVMVDHAIRNRPGGQAEVDAFIDIGRHLRSRGVAVPDIYLCDRFAGLVFIEDLGEMHLQDAVVSRDDRNLVQHYRQVIDQWVHMACAGSEAFQTQWTFQSTHYDRELILERECRYFVEAFLAGYLGRTDLYDDLAPEFELLAKSTIENGYEGFLHRDFQSRNVMVKDGQPYLIDFQSGRLGPAQYDLASLLIDPYVQKSPETQNELYDYAVQMIGQKIHIDADRFKKGYDGCKLTRNLQMLGAFGYLTRVKEKRYFETYIPVALKTLQCNLNNQTDIQLPKLTAIANEIAERIGSGRVINRTAHHNRPGGLP